MLRRRSASSRLGRILTRRLRSAALPVVAPLLEPDWLSDHAARRCASDEVLLEPVEAVDGWRCHQYQTSPRHQLKARSERGQRTPRMPRFPPHCLRRWPHPGHQDHRHQVAVLDCRAMDEVLQVVLALVGVLQFVAEV